MSEIVVSGIAAPDVPGALCETYLPIVGEAKLHLNEDGIAVRAVDPANIAMHFVDLDAAAFEAWDSPGSVTIGINLEAFEDRLDVIDDAGELADLAVDMETRKLHVDSGTVTQQMALIDPDTIRQEPDTPDLDLPNTVVLTGAQLDRVATVVDMVSDHVAIEGDPEGEQVRFAAQGDTDESDVAYGREETLDGTKLTQESESLFSLGYFEDVVKPIPDDAAVTMHFGEEFPLRLEWSALEGHMDVETMVAPRIRSD